MDRDDQTAEPTAPMKPFSPAVEQEGVDELAADPRWPSIVGGCGIAFASLGLIGSCLTFAGAFEPQVMAALASGEPGSITNAEQAALDVEAKYAWLQLVFAPLLFALAAWLLLASIAVVRRQAWGARHTVPLCAARLVAGLAQVGVLIFVASEALGASRAQADHDPSTESVVIGLAVAAALLGVAWSLLYPGFAIVWFSRRKIRREVAGWGGEPG